MSGEIQPYLQPAAVIGAMFLLIKYLVADKITAFTTALAAHEKRIRRTEIRTAQMQGALRAKGCLALDGCPMDSDDDDSDLEGR